MKYQLTTINVKNLDESINFYTNILDMKVINRFSPNKGVEISFMKGEEPIVIELIEGHESCHNSGNITLGFGVDNLEDTIKKLKTSNIEILGGPISVANGVKILFAKDINGVKLSFLENLKF